MKKLIILTFAVLCFKLGFAQEFPAKPNTLVNDYTNTLTAEQISRLENKLVAFDDSTSSQITVVIMKTINDHDINEYALELGRKWGVGGAKKNNGVVLLVAIGDRKLSIQTGYGLEGALPDIYTKRIIEDDIKPYFKTGNYYEGIEEGTNSIISLVKGEYKNDNPKSKQKGSKGMSGAIVIIIIIIIVIILRKGGGGGGSEVIGGRGVADALFWSMLLGGGRNSGGGGFGGGFGGGSSGGGFGGFGGGSFGGGGSSGSW
ncbi:MAG: TPM domain-containing protein [Chitinophagaceae bacterium]|nr:MAG: TPM domain-containing protein [Chitinophagaceae bacterium]